MDDEVGDKSDKCAEWNGDAQFSKFGFQSSVNVNPSRHRTFRDTRGAGVTLNIVHCTLLWCAEALEGPQRLFSHRDIDHVAGGPVGHDEFLARDVYVEYVLPVDDVFFADAHEVKAVVHILAFVDDTLDVDETRQNRNFGSAYHGDVAIVGVCLEQRYAVKTDTCEFVAVVEEEGGAGCFQLFHIANGFVV